MGLLSEGSPLSWPETSKWADHVHKHGIKQFLNLFHKLKGRSKDCLKWGDEVEYMVVQLDHEKKTARLMLNAEALLKALEEEQQKESEESKADIASQSIATWHPEYAAYMVEGTPGKPYGHRMAHFNMVEYNMKLRREEVFRQLKGPNQTALSLTSFPRLGCENFTVPSHKPTPESEEAASRSLFFPDEAIYQGHPRFRTLTRNIRHRRGEKVAINIPVYKDKNTQDPFLEDFSKFGDDGERGRAAKPDHIYLDCMGFGMGCACLQMTFQASSICEARYLYDQLTPLCPIILAHSAASPIHRGYLSDIDCRWQIIAASVDCRTREERGLEPLKENKFVIPKSRYDSIDSYLSPCADGYNDIDLVMDKEHYQELRDGDIDHLLAQHIAHLFVRDPVSLFSEKIHQDDEKDTDHFENIQSTNWQTMRFKPPPPGSPIGWRVEFRPTEVQLTDFENAAYVVFVVMLTRVMLTYKLNLLIPISKVDENMKVAQKRGAVTSEQFYFRKDIMTCNSPPAAEVACGCSKPKANGPQSTEPEYEKMTVNEIINGKKGKFMGLVPLIRQYMESVDDIDVDTSCTILQYLRLIEKRASGELMTTAHWIRDFVHKHPDYKQDSVISERINYDLVNAFDQITKGELDCPELLMKHNTKSKDGIPTAMEKAELHLDDMAARKNQDVVVNHNDVSQSNARAPCCD